MLLIIKDNVTPHKETISMEVKMPIKIIIFLSSMKAVNLAFKKKSGETYENYCKQRV